MRKFIQASIFPICTFTVLLLLAGCDMSANKDSSENEEKVKIESSENKQGETSASQQSDINESNLKSGNFFYIAGDVADVQLKAGDYITQLQQSQQSLQQALDAQDRQQLQNTITSLKTQLTGFNQTLNQLNLKSTEINDIRQNIMLANTQVLKSPWMNGDVDFSQIDFKEIKQQLGSVQSEMLKLAAMLIPQNNSSENEAPE